MATPRPPFDREEGLRVTVPDALAFLRRYALLIVAVFALTVLSAYSALSLMTELYDTHSALLVKLGRENLDAPATAKNTVLSTGLRREDLVSEIQILKSPDLIAQTVDAIGIEAFRPVRIPPPDFFGRVKFYTKASIRAVKDQFNSALIALDLKKGLDERQRAIDGIGRALVVEPERDSDVIGVRLRMPDPNLAVRIQETLIGLYLQRRIDVRQSRGVKEFLDERGDSLRSSLGQAEATVNAWKRENKLVSAADQKALLLQRIQALSTERAKVLSERERLDRQMQIASDLLAASPERVPAAEVEVANTARQAVRDRLAKAQAERARIDTLYHPESTVVRTLEEEISNLTALLASQPATEVGSVTMQVNPLRRQLEERIQDARVQIPGLASIASLHTIEIQHLEGELRAIEGGDARLTALERDRRLAEQNYLAVAGRQQEADIAALLDLNRLSNVSVAIPPSAGVQPVYPRKMLIMALALPLGLFLGIGLAMLLEWMSEDLRDPRQIARATNLKWLGSVVVTGDERVDAA